MYHLLDLSSVRDLGHLGTHVSHSHICMWTLLIVILLYLFINNVYSNHSLSV